MTDIEGRVGKREEGMRYGVITSTSETTSIMLQIEKTGKKSLKNLEMIKVVGKRRLKEAIF